jgi:hypothetical protein
MGGYALSAVATAAGISATSKVVNISVTNSALPPPTLTVAITNPPDGATFVAPAIVDIAANKRSCAGFGPNSAIRFRGE